MGLRIIVFDDDQAICRLLKETLTAKGHQVTTYSNPTEFPYFKEETCPCPKESPCADIMIADIVMPKVEGVAFFKKLKEAGCWPLVKGNVAIMSGYLTIHYMDELHELGIHYLRKPFHLNEITDWVESCQERINQANSAAADPANG